MDSAMLFTYRDSSAGCGVRLSYRGGVRIIICAGSRYSFGSQVPTHAYSGFPEYCKRLRPHSLSRSVTKRSRVRSKSNRSKLR